MLQQVGLARNLRTIAVCDVVIPRCDAPVARTSRLFRQSLAWSLARTMMTVIVLVETARGYSVMTRDEFDGDPASIVSEYDPFER